MTHSPAPFIAGEEYDNHRNEILDADGRCIAVVWTRRGNERTTSREQFKDDPQGMANWRLMTAAPELLEALQSALNKMSLLVPKEARGYPNACFKYVMGGDTFDCDCAICLARKAIAKTTEG